MSHLRLWYTKDEGWSILHDMRDGKCHTLGVVKPKMMESQRRTAGLDCRPQWTRTFLARDGQRSTLTTVIQGCFNVFDKNWISPGLVSFKGLIQTCKMGPSHLMLYSLRNRKMFTQPLRRLGWGSLYVRNACNLSSLHYCWFTLFLGGKTWKTENSVLTTVDRQPKTANIRQLTTSI